MVPFLKITTMDALLNGLSISAKGDTVAVLHDGKNDVTFWLLMVGDYLIEYGIKLNSAYQLKKS